MGKHSADDDSTVHPLVAEALARRPTVAGAAVHAEDAPSRDSSTGWPEPARPGGGGLGWPSGVRPDQPSEPRDDMPAAEFTAAPGDAPAERTPRRGWWRRPGASPAA